MRFEHVAGIACGAALLVAVFWGCEGDSPLDAGSGTIDQGRRGEILQTTFTDVVYDTTYSEQVPTGTGPLLLVGSSDHTQTRVLMRFLNVPDSVVVSQAELVLFGLTTIGTGPDFDMTAHNVTGDWVGEEVTDAKFNNAFDPTPIGVQSVAAVDSDTVVVAIDTSLVTGWSNGSIPNRGLLLQGNGATFTKGFVSLNNFSHLPELRLTYTKGGAAVDSSFFPTADAFIVRRDVAPDAGFLYVGDGVADRAAIRFDVTGIPKTATVSRARLRLSVAPAQSRLSSNPLILAAFPLAVPLEQGGTVVLDSTFTAPQFSLEDSATVIELNVATMVQVWIDGRQPNNGLTIRSLVSNRDIDRVAFESRLAADEALRPQIELDYTVPPEAP